MIHFLIDRERAERFKELYGQPDQEKEYGHQMALFYEEVPKGVPVERIGEGSWYKVSVKKHGRRAALEVFERDFNG